MACQYHVAGGRGVDAATPRRAPTAPLGTVPPMWLIRLFFSPVKIVLFIARTMGYSRFAVFVLGVVVGLMCAPMTGAELRDRLRREVEARINPAAPVVGPGVGDVGPR